MTGAPAALPRLREDLRIVRGGRSLNGAPGWVVQDPLRNRFFTISREMFQLLSLWNDHSAAETLSAAVKARYGRAPDGEEISQAAALMDANFFLTAPVSGGWKALHQRTKKKGAASRILHGYLFFRIPLIRPEPFLRAAWPVAGLIFSRMMVIICALAGAAGLYLISRQWERFLAAFNDLFSLEGAALSLLSRLRQIAS